MAKAIIQLLGKSLETSLEGPGAAAGPEEPVIGVVVVPAGGERGKFARAGQFVVTKVIEQSFGRLKPLVMFTEDAALLLPLSCVIN